MQLSLQEFFNQFPVLRQADIAKMAGMKKYELSGAKQGGMSLTEQELKALNKAIKQLVQDLSKIELTHDHIHNGNRRTSKKQSQ